MKLIKTKKMTSKSDGLLPSNMPMNNLLFWVYELLMSLKNLGKWGSY